MISFTLGSVILIMEMTHLKNKTTEKEGLILLLLTFPFSIMTWGESWDTYYWTVCYTLWNLRGLSWKTGVEIYFLF